MKLIYLKNFRKGFATNSSSTHSVIYKNKEDMFKDLNIFELDYYDRFDSTIAATREAKIKYVAANIWGHPHLWDIMRSIYPQMNEYLPLIKAEMENMKEHKWDSENKFGMYTRGNLYFRGVENIAASVDYLRNIIDDEDIIIVGGSDEYDFVYDTCADHIGLNSPSDVKRKCGVVKNGNYWVARDYFSGDRIRFTQKPDECIPQYPELIDIKITNRCEHNCPFCYMGSNMNGKDASIDEIKFLINSLSSNDYSYYKRRIEFAIGGGNILLYPHLEKLFTIIKDHGHVINTTINVKDVKKICESEELKHIFNTFVSGIGISISNENDVQLLELYNIKDTLKNCKFMLHLIPEMLGVKQTINICSKANSLGYYGTLFLGYKENNRGASCKHKLLSYDDLCKIFDKTSCISVDTTFANRYKSFIENNFHTYHTITFNEGEYSMYIDAVEMKGYKSSYQLDKPYNLRSLGYENKDVSWFTVESAFGKIRQDNGFKQYEKEDYTW